MSDGIEVHFDAKRGHLSLACDVEAFSRIRVLLFEEALISEIVGSPSRDVSRIEIESVPVVVADRQRFHLWSTSLVVGLAGIAALFVFGVGLWTILGWVLQRTASL